jgi:CO dehydrogenase/acetyl-CoA synthase beta subunit
LSNSLKEKFRFGAIYRAQKFPNKDIWFQFGGIKSSLLSKNQKIETNPFLQSQFQSFDLLTVNSNSQIQDSKIEVSIAESISNPTKTKKSRRSKRLLTHDLGILIEISSDQLSIHHEGWLHHMMIQMINDIDGIEFNSINYLPQLRIHNLLSDFKDIDSFLNTIGEYLIKQLHSKFTEIEKIQISFYSGESEIKNIRENIESAIVERRKTYLNQIDSSENGGWGQFTEFYTLPFGQDRSPFYSMLLTPYNSDPCGYIHYSDLSDENFTRSLKEKYHISGVSLGESISENTGEYSGLNKWYTDSTFSSINQIQLWDINYPLPSSSTAEILLFQIPDVPGFGLVDMSFTKPIFNKILFSSFQLKFGTGHQFKGVQFISRYDLVSPIFKKLTNNWEKVAWVNNNLFKQMEQYIPKNLMTKIATELKGTSIDDCMSFWTESQHPMFISKTLEERNLASSQEKWMSMINNLISKPIELDEYIFTLKSPNGMEYEIELKDFQLKAKSIRIKKLTK